MTMSNGPLPSQLCLLPDLALKKEGDKVRFLGCVTAYSSVSGILTLQHHHQTQDSPCVAALVDVTLVLRTLKSDQVRIGEWVNVIGYVTTVTPSPARKGSMRESEPFQARVHTQVRIRALLLWSSGPLDTQRYDESVHALESCPSMTAPNSASKNGQ
ncbi:CST complex subunit Ten1 [Sordaria brevicollis]|uniref:CST complex subunit Ten1 n=1 Tax=Sordaria brevicollis TaxID=83679 RepID=A0AAE0PNE8_SORBR|nr:CST complex subunit Ten1 [Sordaria brevicollis]